MHKIKKGIKKKIKGKKNKGNNELFTEEEYEKYKKEKEEEAKAHLEEDPEGAASDEHILDETADEPGRREDTNDDHEEPVEEATSSEKGGDWRNFFSATDSVLKSTTVNLEHIKEASYFQVNKKHEELAAVEEAVTSVSAAALSSEAPSKGWVDLDNGGIDDDSLEEDNYERREEPLYEEQVKEEPKKVVELKPLDLEDLPTVAAEDYADVFDTTFVDNLESGEVQLFEIPDSPTDDDLNEPDPFDTSGVDKILAVKKKERKSKKSKAKKVPEPQKPPQKKKRNLVNLGCAVDVLTGKATETQGAINLKKAPESKVPEVNLLADFEESSTEVTALTEEAKKEDTENQQTEEKCVVDDILFGIDPDCDLPDIIQIPPQIQPDLQHESTDFDDKTGSYKDDLTNKKSNVTLTELDPLASVEEPKESSKESHLKDLVAEFDVIDRSEEKSITSYAIDDNIRDEFDAEFAVLAAESIAKEKDKAIDELGQLDGDDPFDTSAVNHILADHTCNTEEDEKDPFDVEFANQVVVGNTVSSDKSAPPRPALPENSENFSELDPFDTSAATEFLTTAVDHFDSVEPDISLPETLQPVTGVDLTKSESFDPFDTSAADKFGITELKALEGEFLKDINKDDDLDFDFNPREGEPEVPLSQSEQPSCLLSEFGEASVIQPTLTPQAVDTEVDDFDPFDTSIADKVHIQSLEALLTKEENHSHLEAEVKNKNPPPRPVSPACILSLLNNSETSTTQISSISKHALAEDFDPFDTTIADQFTEDNKGPSAEKVEETQTLKLNFKPLRPASPVCLLGATPEDDNPTLEPISKGIDIVGKPEEELDPFDTSIADQFGKTELKALESELLAKAPVEVDDDFDPRAYEPTDSLQNIETSEPLPKSASPLCLLTGTSPELDQVLPPLSPTEVKCTASADIDPFDTSIANKFGKVEIQNLENELLSDIKFEETISQNFEENQTNQISEPLASANCVFETSPTDTNIPLQPTFQQSGTVSAEEEVDPFDTSIAEQFGKTELKVLEETLLTKENSIPSSIVSLDYSAIKEQVIKTLEVREADILFDISPSADSLPVLQPSQAVSLKEPSPDFDPFDTSIADKFGSTELKALENQLLVDSGTKRGLSDDEFDPREEETKKKSPPEVSNQNILDSHIDFPEQTLAVLEASAVISVSEDDLDPFDTSIADCVGGPSKTELSLLDKEFLG